jgi:hypothetical protein
MAKRVSKKLLSGVCAVACAFAMHSSYIVAAGARAVRVQNSTGDMPQFGYQVQACEDADQNNCTARVFIDAESPVELFLDRLVSARRSGPDIEESQEPVKAYDLLFFAERVPGLMEQVGTLEDVRPGAVVECYDGKAFVQGKMRKQETWTSIKKMRINAKAERPKLKLVRKNATAQDLEAQAERLEDVARDIDKTSPATISTEDRESIVRYRAQAAELRRQAKGGGMAEKILDRPAPSVELEDKRLERDYPTTEAFDMN